MIDFFPFRNLIESFRENFSAMSLKRGENIQFSFLNHDASEARRFIASFVANSSNAIIKGENLSICQFREERQTLAWKFKFKN